MDCLPRMPSAHALDTAYNCKRLARAYDAQEIEQLSSKLLHVVDGEKSVAEPLRGDSDFLAFEPLEHLEHVEAGCTSCGLKDKCPLRPLLDAPLTHLYATNISLI